VFAPKKLFSSPNPIKLHIASYGESYTN